MQLLHIDSSITGTQSVSRQLTRDIVNTWIASNPDTTVEYLDLVANTPNHLAAESLGFRMPPTDAALTEGQRRENAISEALVTQFLAADAIVKSWIDRIVQASRTFTYTATGPKGLAAGKTVIVASTRGGMYSTSEGGRAMEHQESYLQTVFGFLGITDVRFVRAEGVAMGDAKKAEALKLAAAHIKATVLSH
jgi:FMN-dependent NADH-azoreductase